MLLTGNTLRRDRQGHHVTENEMRMNKIHDGPTLEELLRDPMTQALMNADRVDPLALADMLRSVTREIAGRSGGSAPLLVAAESDRHFWPKGLYRDTARCHASGSRARSQHCWEP
jgi:hypothetical protein